MRSPCSSRPNPITPEADKCPACGGVGGHGSQAMAWYTFEPCARCKGAGFVTEAERAPAEAP